MTQIFCDMQTINILTLTLLRLGGYQIDTCLPLSILFVALFCSESEQPDRNSIKLYVKFGLKEQK